MKNKFKVGQRWISNMEPELGLGLITHMDQRKLTLLFRTSNLSRQYSTDNPPLIRICLRIGEQVTTEDNQKFIIEEIKEIEDLFYYIGQNFNLLETQVSDTISFLSPIDRLLAGHVDSNDTFRLRSDMIINNYNYNKSKMKGFIGPRIDIIWHQLFILQESVSRPYQRLLLADEVGLGKTIEACLILHNLLLSGRIERALIIVPNALVYQWFIELIRKFNLTFTIFDNDYYADVLNNNDLIPFQDRQLGLSTMDFIFSQDKIKQEILEASWDLIIVDEIHRLDNDSKEYDWLRTMAGLTKRLLLLTATPEMMGYQSLFAICSLLYPHLYNNFNKFLDDTNHYSLLAEIIEKIENSETLSTEDLKWINEKCPIDLNMKKSSQNSQNPLVEALLDYYGFGRIIFRNTRKYITLFPKRYIYQIPLAVEKDKHYEEHKLVDSDPRITWLVKFLKTNKDQKILLICHTKELVMDIVKYVSKHINIAIAIFHEDMTLIQRDKMAAYFSQADGANLLICSEIGSEGRNFQFSHHLIFFDCPLNVELIEQRIGRLDRIGQKKDIHIYLPYIKFSIQDAIIQILHDGCHSFNASVPYGNRVIDIYREQIRITALKYSEAQIEEHVPLKLLIKNINLTGMQLTQELENGRDKLLERNSYKPEMIKELSGKISSLDKDQTLDEFMLKVFEFFGVQVEDIGFRKWQLHASDIYVDILPGFNGNEMFITFDRKTALISEDIVFLTWDHPMVRGAIDVFIGSEQGNSTFAYWQDKKEQKVYIEARYVLECIAPKNLYIDRFLPTTPIRILIDNHLIDCTKDFPPEQLELFLVDGDKKILKEILHISAKKLQKMVENSKVFALIKLKELIKNSIETMTLEYNQILDRNLYLSKINKHITHQDITNIKDENTQLNRYLSSAGLRLDSIRLILRGS